MLSALTFHRKSSALSSTRSPSGGRRLNAVGARPDGEIDERADGPGVVARVRRFASMRRLR